jgi:subtilisin family serine protease
MRTRPSRSPRGLLLAAAVAGLVLGVGGGHAQEQPASIDEAGWQGVLGVRTPVSTAQRYVVLLKPPSLAAQVRAAGGAASEKDMRGWSARAVAQQEQFLARLAAVGARIAPEYRYTRVVNGFSARLDPTSLALLEGDREVLGVYPVRIAYPAQASESGGVLPTAVADLEIAGLDGSGVTVALLDTGVDPSHPYLRDRVLSGVDVIDPGSGGIAQPHPTIPGRPERHATELAGIIAGTEGPGGLHGIAPGASILPVRVGGWQPNAEGGYSVYSRTDQILAGLEAAIDPNGDGDPHDAARIALVGMVEPYAAFVDGPLPRAIAGAADLDMLTIVPAGNDGRAGPGYGSIAGPGAAESALTVGAADGRLASPTVRVLVRAGLRVLYEDDVPLGGAPSGTVTADAVLVDRRTAARGIAALFADGASMVAGRTVLLPRAALSDDTVEEATSAGALSVVVDGPLPAGAFSLDVPSGVPVVGLAAGVVAEIRAMLAAGIPVTVSIGDVHVATHESGGSVAAFSSRGLAFDGSLKPDLAAPGVSVPTSEPGRGDEGEVRFGTISGTSAAAAVTAGVAAVLAQGRPELGARGLRAALIGSAQRADLDPTASGAGLVDLRSAVQQEIYADPSTVSFGAARPSSGLERVVRITNVSTRRLTVSIGNSAIAPKGVQITFDPPRLRLKAGASGDVVVRADTGDLSSEAGAATGELVLRTGDSPDVHVPWAVAVPVDVDLVSRVALARTGSRVSNATPAALSFVAGSVTGATDPQVRGVELLEIELWREGTRLGLLATRRDVLPGRYTFGLTGRGPTGERLRRGSYVIRVVAHPGDGTREQSDKIEYRVR